MKGGRYDNLPTDLRQLAGVIVKNECIGLFNIGTEPSRQQNLYDEVEDFIGHLADVIARGNQR